MQEGKEILRSRFEAQTDIIVGSCPDDWKKYSQWLEKLAIGQLNMELEKNNNRLRDKIEQAIDILEEAISGNLRDEELKEGI